MFYRTESADTLYQEDLQHLVLTNVSWDEQRESAR